VTHTCPCLTLPFPPATRLLPRSTAVLVTASLRMVHFARTTTRHALLRGFNTCFPGVPRGGDRPPSPVTCRHTRVTLRFTVTTRDASCFLTCSSLVRSGYVETTYTCNHHHLQLVTYHYRSQHQSGSTARAYTMATFNVYHYWRQPRAYFRSLHHLSFIGLGHGRAGGLVRVAGTRMATRRTHLRKNSPLKRADTRGRTHAARTLARRKQWGLRALCKTLLKRGMARAVLVYLPARFTLPPPPAKKHLTGKSVATATAHHTAHWFTHTLQARTDVRIQFCFMGGSLDAGFVLRLDVPL